MNPVRPSLSCIKSFNGERTNTFMKIAEIKGGLTG